MMQVQMMGMRFTRDHWLEAQRAPLEDLPILSHEDERLAQSTGDTPESYARSLYAFQLSQPDLLARAELVASLAEGWGAQTGFSIRVVSILLRLTQGLIDLDIQSDLGVRMVEVDEALVDDLLTRGSIDAAESLNRLFAANFGRLDVRKAS